MKKIIICILLTLIVIILVASSKNKCEIKAQNFLKEMNSSSYIKGYWSVEQFIYNKELNTCFAEYKVSNLEDKWLRYYIYNLERKEQIDALVIDNNGQGGAYKNFEKKYYNSQLKIFGQNKIKENIYK